jgi:DNA-binding NarL/FixJ family response regulator
MKPDTEATAINHPTIMANNTKARLLLADDHALFLEGLGKLLEPEFDIVGTVKDGLTLVTEAQCLKPDAILMDIAMPLLNGMEAARQLHKSVPQSKLIFVTMHTDRTFVTEAFRAGASGYLLKQSAGSELVFAIREVLKGHQYVTPMVTKGVLHAVLTARSQHQPRVSSGALTMRQREILQLVAEGLSLRDIAQRLNISIKTVEYHKSRLMERLGFRSTAELTKYAITEGIISL